MRYEVDSPYLFIYDNFEAARARFGRLYLPWEDRLIKTHVIEVTCTEHHRVPGEWEDEIKYDGFVFTDNEGGIWHNQYPRASYGQLDDSGDWRISEHFVCGESESEADAVKRVIAESEEKYGDGWVYFEDARKYLEKIIRAIRQTKVLPFTGNAPPLGHEEKAALGKHYRAVVSRINDLGYRVEEHSHVWHFTNGKSPEIDHSIRHVTLTKIG